VRIRKCPEDVAGEDDVDARRRQWRGAHVRHVNGDPLAVADVLFSGPRHHLTGEVEGTHRVTELGTELGQRAGAARQVRHDGWCPGKPGVQQVLPRRPGRRGHEPVVRRQVVVGGTPVPVVADDAPPCLAHPTSSTRGRLTWLEPRRAGARAREYPGGSWSFSGHGTTELTARTFEQTVLDSELVLVDFWASWCGPCRQFAPVYDAASEEHPDVVFGKVDTEAEEALSAAVKITSIPTVMAFRQGILVHAQAGGLSAPALRDLIEGLRSLDMDEVRSRVAARSESSPPLATAG